MKPIYHPAIDSISLEGVLYALSDPVRLEIVHHLVKKPSQSCLESCGTQCLSKSTLSRHYDILRANGLVFTEKKGVQYTNRVRREELNKRFPGVLDAILKNYSKKK